MHINQKIKQLEKRIEALEEQVGPVEEVEEVEPTTEEPPTE